MNYVRNQVLVEEFQGITLHWSDDCEGVVLCEMLSLMWSYSSCGSCFGVWVVVRLGDRENNNGEFKWGWQIV